MNTKIIYPIGFLSAFISISLFELLIPDFNINIKLNKRFFVLSGGLLTSYYITKYTNDGLEVKKLISNI